MYLIVELLSRHSSSEAVLEFRTAGLFDEIVMQKLCYSGSVHED